MIALSLPGAASRTKLKTAVANGLGDEPSASTTQLEVRRRFIRMGSREVHYLRAGVGSPVILLHSAPVSARFELPLIRRLAGEHTVFAFDNPGFGDTDPLPAPRPSIADAADAIAAVLQALQIPRCPVYGSHTGGAIACELARRHPTQVSGLVVDGANVFTDEEAQFLLSDEYMPALEIKGDGTHLITEWMIARDVCTWFPWSKRCSANRLGWAFPTTERLNHFFIDRLRSGDRYRPLYRSVFKHDFAEALAALSVPATVMAQEQDILFPHLDRLPPPKRDQKILRFEIPAEDYVEERARVVRSYAVAAQAPQEQPFAGADDNVSRRFVDLSGGQILVRSAGETGNARPLLLIHDGRASSRMFEPIMRRLADSVPVYALDLPDNGVSDVLVTTEPRIGAYADAVEDTLSALGLDGLDIYGVGAGAAVALDLIMRPAFADARALLEAPDFYDAAFAGRLAQEWAPPVAPQSDGTHLIRLWLMVRDEFAHWPWFDKSPAAARALDAPTDWSEMHARISDILRSLPTYHRLTASALNYDWSDTLHEAGPGRVTLTATADDPRRPHAEIAARITGFGEVAVVPHTDKAQAILRLLGR